MNISGDAWASPAVSITQSRPWWKTFLFGILLMLVPVVRWSMATHYVMTHEDPDAYEPGKAASAGMLLIIFGFIATLMLGVLVGLLWSL